MLEGEPKFEEEKPVERESGISRVVGASPEQAEKMLAYYNNIEFAETEKTKEELQIIDTVLQKMPDFIRRYGGVPVNVDVNRIHFINEGVDADTFRQAMGQDAETEGFYSKKYQLVVVFKSKGDLHNAHSFVHELLHFNAFQSLATKNGGGLKHRRNGFSIINAGGDSLFEDIDEAVIERLTVAFDKEYFSQIPALAESFTEREEIKQRLIKKSPESQKFIEGASFISKVGNEFDVTTGRDEEIEKLDQIIEKVYLENKDSFESEEGVFNLFARAVMNGSLLPIARLIEKTYGKGSFRELGEKNKKIS